MADFDFDRLDFRAGDKLNARDLQSIVDAVRRALGKVTGGTGIDVRQDATGNVQITGRQPLRFVGKANGAIPAASGTAWGTGVVTMYAWDVSAEYSLGVDYDVLNPSSTTMTSGHGIDSGQRVKVWEDMSGNLIVEPLECS